MDNDLGVLCYLDGPCGNHGKPGTKRNTRERGCWLPSRSPRVQRLPPRRGSTAMVTMVARRPGELVQRCCICEKHLFAHGPLRDDVRCTSCAADIAWMVSVRRQGLKVVWN